VRSVSASILHLHCLGNGRDSYFILNFINNTCNGDNCVAVISIIHGYTWGLALDLVCCSDIRLCTSASNISVKEVSLGVVADLGSLQLLPRIVGNQSWVKEVCLTAREFDADEAMKVGFVSRVLETKEQALEAGLKLAGLIASRSPVAVQGTKAMLGFARDHGLQDGKLTHRAG
jgi:delta(3,5)-delta(2,4)-dienoyl-CoA isomerase